MALSKKQQAAVDKACSAASQAAIKAVLDIAKTIKGYGNEMDTEDTLQCVKEVGRCFRRPNQDHGKRGEAKARAAEKALASV